MSSLEPTPLPGGVKLAGARNETLSFAVQVDGGPGDVELEVSSLAAQEGSARIEADHCQCYDVEAVDIYADDAGYIRQTGGPAVRGRYPRAMVPVENSGSPGKFAIRLEANARKYLWVDLQIPSAAAPGSYSAVCRINFQGQVLASLPVGVTVYDLLLPSERHLKVVGDVSFDRLNEMEPALPRIDPGLVSRRDPACAGLVAELDAMQSIAQGYRAQIYTPQLSPSVKWPAGAAPEIDWTDFDSVVDPWLRGQMFADQSPLAWWPIPWPPELWQLDVGSRQEYWKAAALHFSQKNWLARATVVAQPGRVGEVLAAHPLLNAVTPERDDQVSPEGGDRVTTAADGLVASSATRLGVRHWLDSWQGGAPPYCGAAADEADLRLWAWLAYVRGADLAVWNDAMNGPDAWFYPGEAFGVNHPVADIRLAWLRRAEQDYEYLWLAEQRGQGASARALARLLVRPAQSDTGGADDPADAILCGTSDVNVFNGAVSLIARTIQPPQPGGEMALNVDMAEWRGQREQAVIIPRTVDWQVKADGDQVGCTIGVDVFNATNRAMGGTNDASSIGIADGGRGWQFDVEPAHFPEVKDYHVGRVTLSAKFDASLASGVQSQPLQLAFQNGFTGQHSIVNIVLPVGVSLKVRTAREIDGRLQHWSSLTRIQNGPLVGFLDGVNLAAQRLAPAEKPAQVHTAWGTDDFYVAFGVEGAGQTGTGEYRNFVGYDRGRAWGEDLCEVLIAPVDAIGGARDGMHVVCKPTSPWVERKSAGGDWEPAGDAAIRYAATVKDGEWQGELAIPWRAIVAAGEPIPKFLRFNFSQHVNATGASASWAGPVDSGRDERMMGLLELKE